MQVWIAEGCNPDRREPAYGTGAQVMSMVNRIWMTMGFLLIGQNLYAQTAELRATAQLSMPPGTTASVVVSGAINGELTAAVGINVEFVPVGTTTGTLTFTPALSAAEVDIVQLGDPCPARDPPHSSIPTPACHPP